MYALLQGFVTSARVKLNVNVYVYSLISHRVQQTSHNLHPWHRNSLLYSLISSGENSALAHFAAAIANYYNLACSFHQVPITVGWTEAAWYERLAQHLYIWPAAWPCATTCVGVVIGPARLFSQYVTGSLWLDHWECHITSVDCSATFLSSMESNTRLLRDRREV